ncbi:3,4-dihydroxyphenylacetate 2,3-dioxygenase [Streptomyces sp. SDr-06]|uniref:3,4-dihydroxyphenylacetate 2,3-dioxygenase n=1 Tax=Streptomyces sp. SDr-06 TaxID=2267702 RepID=UPI000DEA8B5C|nr:3,4-dihydroxyphenylacetate 2,3-dioxygenase [Streptomyces sp. SDr-06]RCH67322.1 catechol 1,2-dioxygenase [Streptomyces sp. SDr-06]
MGEIVGAGLLAHVPTIVLPEPVRRELNYGSEISLVTGLRQLRADVFESDGYDTVVVLDSHWATTVEFVIAAQSRRAGLFTSEELPRGMCRMPYDFAGDPELARRTAGFAARHQTWITAIDDPCLPVHYATVNLWKFLGEGLPDKRWMSIGVCQTGDSEDHLRLGRALADGIAATPGRRVLLLASGALSHTFWPLRELRDHEASDPVHIRTPEARAADLERIGWFKEGRHRTVLDTLPEFREFRPEAGFAHYLMMAGALGGEACTAPGRQYGAYENSIGTGQVHLWFDRPADGWTGAGPPAPHAVRHPHRRDREA